MKLIDVMIIGTQKAATSSLKMYMGQHPNICANRRNEINYFVRDEEYLLGYQYIYQRYFKNCQKSSVLLGKSVGIMYEAESLKRLKAHNPNVKLIMMLRNPVDRAYSAYWYARSKGWEDIPTFEKALNAGPDRFKELVKRRNCAYLERGIYHKYIELVYQYFNRKSSKVILLEDLLSDPLCVLKSSFEFINASASFVPEISKKFNKSRTARYERLASFMSTETPLKSVLKVCIPEALIFRIRSAIKKMNEVTFSPPPMNIATRNYLIEYFRTHNEKLGEILGREMSHWNI